MTNPYNSFSWQEREAKFKEMNRLIAKGELAHPHGPCRLCGDHGGEATGVIFEYHDENYGHRYTWQEPAAYMVCRDCHIYRIHQRTARPESWKIFLAHVRRGGFAREMRDATIQTELRRNREAILRGVTRDLRTLRPYPCVIGEEWFANLPENPYAPPANAP